MWHNAETLVTDINFNFFYKFYGVIHCKKLIQKVAQKAAKRQSRILGRQRLSKVTQCQRIWQP